MLSKDVVLGLVRHLLTFGGGFLLAKGVFDQATLDAVVPAAITIIGAVWSAFDKKPV